MKKRILLSLAAVMALAIGVAGMSAYEAHVINVTAHIENALSVNTTPIEFGTVFPQEYFTNKSFTMGLSESFLASNRVDDVEYKIVQKLKPCPIRKVECVPPQPGVTCSEPIDPTCVPDTEDQTPHNQTGWHYLSLCQYLSKGPDNTPRNDTGERSYFQGDHCIAPTPQDGAIGRLAKSEQDLTDTWVIDLKVPPVIGQAAQDWPADCPTVAENDKTYGCDLWVEVTGISETPVPTEPSCGNGIIEPGEQCDDSNTVNGDGCSSTCQIETH